ncbi:hypothetical protein [Sporomusa aerivorans]|uniref:hypothetical protein n=1 Tax=Sporomusa aerivorans TaxID=204936 RepID=UPI00352B9479
MKRSISCLVLLYICLLYPLPAAAAQPVDMAARWAPVICQTDGSDGLAAPQNIFTLINYDRDWRLNNNWYNLLFYPLDQAMYYSVVESDTHYFIGYYQYYPRHAGGGHEHDLTGVLAAVSKTPDGAGRLDMLVTYSNHQWQKWSGSRVRLEGRHPVVKIRTASHEITALGKSRRALPATALYAAAGGGPAGYRLVPLTQLWEQRQDIGSGRVFARWGYFDSFNAIKVTAPWLWEYHRLNWLATPGELIQYFRGRPVKACQYLSNPYQAGR